VQINALKTAHEEARAKITAAQITALLQERSQELEQQNMVAAQELAGAGISPSVAMRMALAVPAVELASRATLNEIAVSSGSENESEESEEESEDESDHGEAPQQPQPQALGTSRTLSTN
jgi:hypothetical protein